MPILTAAEYRLISGVSDDPPSDDEIELGIAKVQAMAESYCSREFDFKLRTETYLRVAENPLLLWHWPVADVTKVATQENGEAEIPDVRHSSGLVFHDHAWDGQTVTITYSAGFETAPDDLKFAVAALVESQMAGESAPYPIRKETVYGVSAVEYSVDPVEGAVVYPGLAPFQAVFDKYRRAFIP